MFSAAACVLSHRERYSTVSTCGAFFSTISTTGQCESYGLVSLLRAQHTIPSIYRPRNVPNEFAPRPRQSRTTSKRPSAVAQTIMETTVCKHNNAFAFRSVPVHADECGKSDKVFDLLCAPITP